MAVLSDAPRAGSTMSRWSEKSWATVVSLSESKEEQVSTQTRERKD